MSKAGHEYLGSQAETIKDRDDMSKLPAAELPPLTHMAVHRRGISRIRVIRFHHGSDMDYIHYAVCEEFGVLGYSNVALEYEGYPVSFSGAMPSGLYSITCSDRGTEYAAYYVGAMLGYMVALLFTRMMFRKIMATIVATPIGSPLGVYAAREAILVYARKRTESSGSPRVEELPD
eukprot:NODE_998_length_690_cov_35.421517_g989_i0.p1 GENE.NODE_998_length_690_cov_35.421517_g989_i0~~NODE_998_length_690_cov_35.421517_g989_i0.p1  ORF type:complete len:192 (+),score=23.68 NODE_998_length_690_cov_35.421517_g989_i0:49-576(+)